MLCACKRVCGHVCACVHVHVHMRLCVSEPFRLAAGALSGDEGAGEVEVPAVLQRAVL